jgi:hypothetical protein
MASSSKVDGTNGPEDPRDDSGVDRALIHWMLERTPLERAQKAGELARGIVVLRGRSRGPHSAPRLGARGVRGMAVSFTDVLRTVATSDAEVLVIGMIAAVLQGAPLVTFGVDLVHRDTPENEARVAALLEELGARVLAVPEGHDEGDRESHEPSEEPPIEVVSHHTLADSLTYDDLLARSVVVELGDGLRVRALSLEQVIELKKRLGRPKDRVALPALEATLEEARARDAAK